MTAYRHLERKTVYKRLHPVARYLHHQQPRLKSSRRERKRLLRQA